MKYAALKSSKTYHQCTGCLACLDSCNHKAIRSAIDAKGHIIPILDKHLCVNCGRCDAVCPVVDINKTISSESKPYAVWTLNDKIRKHSASGGIFSALAKKIIVEGGYVSGAIIEGCKVKHIVTNNIEDVRLIQGSKYQQGSLEGIYNEIKKRLKEGNKVLFSGSPCQVVAIKRFLINNKYIENLLTVDFFCGGFPSILPLEVLIDNCGFEVRRIVSFRNKDDGWKSVGYRYKFQLEDTEGSIHSFTDNNIVSKAFISHLTNRDSCLNCSFATANRCSDITIGDYWGCKNYREQEKNGISVVVVHNHLMIDILRNADVVLNPIKWKDFVYNNPRAIIGKFYGFKYHWMKWCYPYIFRNMNYRTICALFSVGYLPWWGQVNNVMMRIIKKIDKRKKKSIINNRLKTLDK